MDRRGFIGILAGGFCAAPLASKAQQSRQIRLGWLAIEPLPDRLDVFRHRLRDLGYVEHVNLVLDERYAYGRAERLAELAAELVRLKPDALITIGTPASLAAQRATTTLPIVFIVGDPVGSRLVASLSHPGANLTGLAIITTELNGKRVELLKEAVPSISRIAVLTDVTAAASYGPASWHVIEAAAKEKAIKLIPALDVRSVDDLDAAFATALKQRVDAMLIGSSPVFGTWRQQIVALAAKTRLPVIYELRRFVDIGGLMSYGPDIDGVLRRAAIYIDKILKGTKPADLPVERPTKVELVINLKTAKALGITIPQSLLLRADELVQ
jgi:putative ABC transport system substrate-binding protein